MHRGARRVEKQTLFGQKVSPGVSYPVLRGKSFGGRKRLRGDMGLNPSGTDNTDSVSVDVFP